MSSVVRGGLVDSRMTRFPGHRNGTMDSAAEIT